MSAVSKKLPWEICQFKFSKATIASKVIKNFNAHAESFWESLAPSRHDDDFPYFATVWPAALGLCSFLDQMDASLAQKNILEIGCGSGLPSLFAHVLGARVTALDINQEIEPILHEICALNHKEPLRFLAKSIADPTICHHLIPESFDMILASDMIYQPELLPQMARLAHTYLKPSGLFIYADPGRYLLDDLLHEFVTLSFNLDGHCVWQKEGVIEVLIASKTG